MEVVIAAGGLPFGPTTLSHRSLGGSETAAMHLALEIRKLGHIVSVFCNLPPQGHPDYFESGHSCSEGVRWVALEQYAAFISHSEVDLLIVSRDPAMFALAHQAKKAIFWMHDLATIKTFKPRLMDTAWNFDEIWTVSEWHRQQVHENTGYPLDHIVATRNGIVAYDVMDIPREEKSLLYSARPERGLEILVKEGGVMEHLPDFNLKVTMYENYPDHMMEFYHKLWARCQDLPNVDLLGPKTQLELRQIMKATWAYIYPTRFEEVSCIIARECIEQELPVFTTPVGALVETLGDCAIFYEGSEENIGSEEFCSGFADLIIDSERQAEHGRWAKAQSSMRVRQDLYWGEVAVQFIDSCAYEAPGDYSLALSLIKDSDVIPAWEILKNADKTRGTQWLIDEIYTKYPFLTGDISYADHYDKIYIHEDEKNVRERSEMVVLNGSPRFEVIKEMIPEDAQTVIEYGCAEGPIILGLAQEFPEIQFTGIDIVLDNVELCRKYAEEHNITNVEFYVGDISEASFSDKQEFDVAIIAEVLEHVEKPWECLNNVEKGVKIGGRVIGTTPSGPWEWSGLRNHLNWNWRAHIWHLDKKAMRSLLTDKEGVMLTTITHSHLGTRSLGHVGFGYICDREDLAPIDIQDKVRSHRVRQSIGACMIAMNDQADILKCLDSIANHVDIIQIALGPSSDRTQEYVNQWSAEHPWVELRWRHVPRIHSPEKDVGGFGFDDARNASMEGMETDWIFWIDCDEYLSGQTLSGYCRNNAFDSYALFQHHFACEPRGNPPQLDKPARLIRNHHGFQFFGKVHEHAEIGFNGGPGFVMVLSDLDIGHTGYVNEDTRMNRFARNYPLLEWDREVYPDRKIGGYLWLRDMIHRIKIVDNMGDKKQARQLAEEAIQFYKANVESWGAVGGGLSQNSALAYYSGALEYLDIGAVVTVTMSFEGQEASYVGRFVDAKEAMQLGEKGLKEQFDLLNNRYNQ